MIRTAMAGMALLAVAALAGCASADRMAHAEALAATGHLKPERIEAGAFVLTAFVRIDRPDRPLTLYIEGDGPAWLSRSEPAQDPTPRAAIGLALAASDRAPNVAYLARPCQFTPMALNPSCNVAYWTGKRFAPEVVASIDAAITRLAARVPGQPIALVGYSGGAALAVLVAAERRDVVSIRTLAGNLDSEAVNRLHHVSAMPQSENPIDVADRVAAIPQIHFSGARDEVVPPEIAQRFAAATGHCARVMVVPGLDHEGDWPARWPTLLAMPPACAD